MYSSTKRIEVGGDSNLTSVPAMLKTRKAAWSRKPSLLILKEKKLPGDNYIYAIKERKRKIVNSTTVGGLLTINSFPEQPGFFRFRGRLKYPTYLNKSMHSTGDNNRTRLKR